MSYKITFEQQMAEILAEIGDGANEAMAAGLKLVAKTTPRKLRNRSPEKTGVYKRGWKATRPDAKTVIIYNADAPGLAHLLEDGHRIVNKKGEFGSVKGIPHIKPVEEEENEAFFNEVMQQLDKNL